MVDKTLVEIRGELVGGCDGVGIFAARVKWDNDSTSVDFVGRCMLLLRCFDHRRLHLNNGNAKMVPTITNNNSPRNLMLI